MIGSLITRGLLMLFGYAYPAYECYKTVDKNKADVEQLRFWCQYWILVAMLTVFERVGDALISWVPMYGEAKLFFYIYLWYPKTKGTTYVYDSFFRPYVAKHETDIDRNLLELRTRAGDYAVVYWQRATNYAQTRILDILQFVSSQSTPNPRTTQPQQGTKARQPTAAQNREAAPKTLLQTKKPPSPASETSSSEAREVLVKDNGPSEVPPSVPAAAVSNSTKSAEQESVAGSPKPTTSNREATSAEAVSSSSEDLMNPSLEDIIMEEATTRVTRGSLRRTRAASVH